ncbi:hypothetical protein, partial [Streptomyces galilaeus]|uniref:hypothetical protein n=1 Tax=Streptomyces galilaeus TaxID=33899 RepID=UPI0038F7273E
PPSEPPQSREQLDSEQFLQSHSLPSDPDLQQLTIQEEMIRLSLRNIGPRGAFFHRLSVFTEYCGSFQKMVSVLSKEMEQEAEVSHSSTVSLMLSH